MKQRIQFCEGVLLFALLVGAFFLPVMSARAASATTYNRALPGEVIVNGHSKVIAYIPFRTNRNEALSLRTLQNANLGSYYPDHGSPETLTITVNLDGVVVDMFLAGSTRIGFPLTQIGISTRYLLPIGQHILSITYADAYTGPGVVAAQCTTHPTCPFARIYPGKLTLRVA